MTDLDARKDEWDAYAAMRKFAESAKARRVVVTCRRFACGQVEYDLNITFGEPLPKKKPGKRR